MILTTAEFEQIRQGLKATQKSIAEALQEGDRPANTVTLLAVSKTQPADKLRYAYSLGQTAFGENYLQEARLKQQSLADLPLVWHFIGPIQSNKTREIAVHFDWVHSVDRFKIAKRLSRHRPGELPPMNICLQVNLDAEDTKAGVSLDELPHLIERVAELPRLALRGLMAIPAPRKSYSQQLAIFRKLAAVKSAYTAMDSLSMGMSGDMRAAIVAGATIVRIGTAIFGQRRVQ